MRIEITEQELVVRLALWQKILGLMRDIHLARSQIVAAELVQDPLREAMRAGIKVGLRIPWLYFVARTIRLDQAFVVRRRVPALGLSVENAGALRRVLVSSPEAEQLVSRLQRP
jgi:hypothetical protein